MEVINLRLFYSLLAGLSGNFRCRCRRPSARNERTDRYRYEPITGRDLGETVRESEQRWLVPAGYFLEHFWPALSSSRSDNFGYALTIPDSIATCHAIGIRATEPSFEI